MISLPIGRKNNPASRSHWIWDSIKKLLIRLDCSIRLSKVCLIQARNLALFCLNQTRLRSNFYRCQSISWTLSVTMSRQRWKVRRSFSRKTYLRQVRFSSRLPQVLMCMSNRLTLSSLSNKSDQTSPKSTRSFTNSRTNVSLMASEFQAISHSRFSLWINCTVICPRLKSEQKKVCQRIRVRWKRSWKAPQLPWARRSKPSNASTLRTTSRTIPVPRTALLL